MKRLLMLMLWGSAVLATNAQTITPQNLFVLTPQERALFDAPSEYSHTWGSAFEDYPLRRLWEAFNTGIPPQGLSATAPVADWVDLDGGGSQNHSLLWMGTSVLAYALNNDPANYDAAANTCLTMIGFNKVQGHMRYEAVGFYTGFWEGGMAAMALGGLYAPAGSTKGPELLAASRAWWADHIAVLRALSMPDGQVHLVGARSYGNEGERDDYGGISIAVNLQLIDPRPHGELHPRIAALITEDGQPSYGKGSVYDIQWHNYRHVAERWLLLRALQSGAILRVPANQPKPFVAQDFYRWQSNGVINIAAPSVTGLCPIRWHSSWAPGELIYVSMAGDDPNDCGKGPHPFPRSLGIPGSANKVLGSNVTSSGQSSSAVFNDAAIVDIVAPYKNACATAITPMVVIKNAGQTVMTELALYYQIDDYTLFSDVDKGATRSKRYSSGANPGLAPGETISLKMDLSNVTTGVHRLRVWVMDVNNLTDWNTNNNRDSIFFNVETVGASLNYSEDFESAIAGNFPVGYELYNKDNDKGWFLYDVNGNKAVAIDNFDYINAGNEADEIKLPLLDLSAGGQLHLEFDLSHTSKTTTSVYDSLEIKISTDCGSNWSSLWAQGGKQLNTAPEQDSRFIPSGMEDFRHVDVSLNAYAGNKTALIKFINYSNGGNSTLIDNINVHAIPLMVKEYEKSPISLFPNPASGQVSIRFSSTKGERLTHQIVDMSGRVVYQQIVQASAGENYFTMDISALTAGVYNYSLTGNTQMLTGYKLIVD